MKCYGCGKKIEGRYIQVDNIAFHPECFVCSRCKKAISGKFQPLKGKFFHPHCYQEKMGFVCSECGKLLGDAWVVYEGKKYHSHCLQIRCGICGELIKEEEHAVDKKGKYHKRCFLEKKLPRCNVCDQPISGKYIVDQWGHRSHPGHGGKRTVTCDYCSRIVSYPTSNGGYTYDDGRVVCGVCKLTAVENNLNVRRSMMRVLKLLGGRPAYFSDIPGGVPIKLVDRGTLNRLLGGLRTGNTHHGLTKSESTYQGNKRIKTKHQIFILYGMPQLEFDATLAHELLHTWLYERETKLSRQNIEGFCNLGAAIVYNADNSPLAKILLERMEAHSNRMYAAGYRTMKRKLLQQGWHRLKQSVSKK